MAESQSAKSLARNQQPPFSAPNAGAASSSRILAPPPAPPSQKAMRRRLNQARLPHVYAVAVTLDQIEAVFRLLPLFQKKFPVDYLITVPKEITIEQAIMASVRFLRLVSERSFPLAFSPFTLDEIREGIEKEGWNGDTLDEFAISFSRPQLDVFGFNSDEISEMFGLFLLHCLFYPDFYEYGGDDLAFPTNADGSLLRLDAKAALARLGLLPEDHPMRGIVAALHRIEGSCGNVFVDANIECGCIEVEWDDYETLEEEWQKAIPILDASMDYLNWVGEDTRRLQLVIDYLSGKIDVEEVREYEMVE